MSIQPRKRTSSSSNPESSGHSLEKKRLEHEIDKDNKKSEKEDKKERQIRADALRAKGSNTQAFIVEHNLMPAIGIGIFFLVMFGFIGYQNLKSDSVHEKGAEINLKLEAIEDQIHLAIRNGDANKAMELTNKLVHPMHEKWEDESKSDLWNGYPYYDEWWTKKRNEYKEQIMDME